MHSILTTARHHIVSTLILSLLFLAGCDKIGVEPSNLDEDFATTEAEIMAGGPAVTIDSVSFSDDYRNMTMQMHRHKNFDQYFIGDSSSVRIDVKEYVDVFGLQIPSRLPATLTETRIVGPREIDRLDIRLTFVVDLTLDYTLVERQRHALTDIYGLFRPERVQVRFITDEGISEPYSCTNYLINTHFIPTGTAYKQLYRDILIALTQQRGQSDGVIVMSDGRVYDEDNAMDDDHFALQERIYNICTRGDRVSSYPPLYYYDLNPAPLGESDVTMAGGQESESIIQLLTNYTGGYITNNLTGYELISDVLDRRGIDFSAIGLTLSQPEGKSFYGAKHEYAIEFRDAKTDSLIATASHEATLGSVTHPVYTAPLSLKALLLRGLVCIGFILFLLFAVFQLLVPWISFCIFRHRYIGRYCGLNTYIGGHIADGQCYYCKQQFALGDEVVSACRHTMHRECWEAGEYRCPEHGHDPDCKDSHHYYNRYNLFDRRNAHYSYRWFLWTTLAAFSAWACKSIFSTVPMVILFAFMMTAVYSTLSMQRTHRYSTVVYVLARATAACMLVAVFYILFSYFSLRTEHPALLLVLDTLLSLSTAVVIAFASTWRTMGALKTRRLVLGLVALSVIKLLFSGVFFFSEEQINLVFLFNVVIESFTLCTIVCFHRSRSLHYFLHLEGCGKPVDVALYKWFNAHPTAIVAIGSSPDCDLKLDWDLQGSVAPLQARISQQHGRLFLEPTEGGVFDGNGHAMSSARPVRLYHGYRFIIGNNVFTFVEKDRKN